MRSANCRLRIILAVLLGVLGGSATLRAAEIDDLIRNAPSRDKYPEAGALILLDRVTVTIDRNNDATSERYWVAKILEERAKDELGDVRRRFDKDGQSCDVLIAQTHRPDGSVVKPEPKAIAEVSAPEVAEAPAYSNARLRIVSFPALERGAVMEYQVRVSPKKSEKAEGFSGVVAFGGFEPILRRELILNVPVGMKFDYGWLGQGVEPQVETLDQNVRYTWRMNDLPQVFREPSRPPNDKLVPTLWYSSFADWKQAGEHLWKPFAKGLVSSPETKQKAGELTSGKSRADALRDIFLYVTQKYTNVSLEYGAAGYQPHAAAAVIEQKYGDCRDKVCLLITLLKDAGFSAVPVAVKRDAVPVNRAIPVPEAFGHLICEAKLDGQPVYLDPLADYFPCGYLGAGLQGSEALVLEPNASQPLTLPADPPESNLALVSASLKLDSSGALSGTIVGRMTGSYDARVRGGWRDQTPIERKRSLDEQIAGIKTGAKVDSFWFSDLADLTRPAAFGIRFTAPDYATRQIGRLFFRVPPIPIAADGFGPTTARERHTPLVNRPVRIYRCTCSVSTPQGFHFQTPPAPWKMENALCRASIDWTEMPDRVVFVSEIVILKPEITVAEYPQLKAVADQFYRPDHWQVYFTK